MNPRKNGAVALLVALAAVIGTLGFARGPAETFRSCGPVLEQEVCTWALMTGSKVLELGATVPLALIESVPHGGEMSWPPQQLAAIAIPEEARASLGIDHLGINWEPHGHPPGAFMTPHFDFHFYNITSEELDAIDCADESKPGSLPAGYGLPDIDVPGLGMLHGLCVPRMGMHAMPASEIDADEAFRATMVMGYYAGKPIFFEPMVSQTSLLERSDFTLEIPSVANLPVGVRYPREFSATFDAALDEYRFVARGFEDR